MSTEKVGDAVARSIIEDIYQDGFLTKDHIRDIAEAANKALKGERPALKKDRAETSPKMVSGFPVLFNGAEYATFTAAIREAGLWPPGDPNKFAAARKKLVDKGSVDYEGHHFERAVS